MAHFYVTNSLYPENPQLFTITIKEIVKLSGEPGTIFSKGNIAEEFWELCISTSGLTNSGTPISPEWIDVKGNKSSIDELISSKVSDICSRIDWSQRGQFSLQQDRYSPIIIDQFPIPGQMGVPIDSVIKFILKEHLPGTGVDFDSIKLKIKGVEVKPLVVGTPFNCEITFKPKAIK